MFYERKTKSQNAFSFIFIPISFIVVWLVLSVTVGFEVSFYFMGGIFVVVSVWPFITFWRTRNSGFLAVGTFQFAVGLVCFSAPPAIADKSEAGLIPLFLAIMYGAMLVSFYHLVNRKLKWRGVEIFELAAGQTQVSKTEMIRFVDFITRSLIAFPFKEENRIVFVLALPKREFRYLLGMNQNYLEDTWVAVNYDGNVSVHITEKDYLLFKQDLNFDQLCESLGDVFIEFLELSKAGRESQIIDKMNALRLNPLAD
ncbi:MAG: hypothetical protein P8046_12710 [Anaerolineales bacterium]